MRQFIPYALGFIGIGGMIYMVLSAFADHCFKGAFEARDKLEQRVKEKQ